MSLQQTYNSLRREVGRFLGYGRTPSGFSATESTDVDDVISAGLRAFYWPNIGDARYTWSFLKKLTTISTVSGTRSYDLPVDFGGSLREFSYANSSGKRPVSRCSEEEIRSLYSKNDLSGSPTHFAIRAKDTEAGDRTRYEVLFWPVPNDAYTLSYRYSIEPPELDDQNTYPLGSAVHSECILEACLAAAEKTILPEGTEGLHKQRFDECLQASVKLDMEMQ